ncbi:hypothetical protein DFH09DRAFT_1278711 [Mycena vulgaris]|nr:hypothetical protein DFH09DRAFT_1278711 [Mycena vulgaris]
MPHKKLFRGEYAVFSHQVDEACLHLYVAMGGQVASEKEEIEQAVLFVCKDIFDRDFIAIWYNSTYRVVTQRFILDCKVVGHRPEERGYSWAVDPETYAIVPAHTLLQWPGSVMKPVKEKSKSRTKSPQKPASLPDWVKPVLAPFVPAPNPIHPLDKPEEARRPRYIGLPTPAPSFDST